jgi:uncharacterized membrane protein YvlD (DUF360 family)
MRFMARLLLDGVAVLVAAWLIPGLQLSGPGVAFATGAVLAWSMHWCARCSSC